MVSYLSLTPFVLTPFVNPILFFQQDVYWQSVATETFQGILLSRITCRTCGRHSDQPDRFYDLSLPLLPVATALSSMSSSAEAKQSSPPLQQAASGSSVGYRPSVSPTLESPGLGWEPPPSHQQHQHQTVVEERRGSSVVVTEGGDGESAVGGDRGSDWGSWRRQRGGWCSATVQRDEEKDRDGDGGGNGSYVRDLVSSMTVWLGIKSVPLEVWCSDCVRDDAALIY